VGREYSKQGFILGEVPFGGENVYWDDFDTRLNWNSSGTGTDWTAELSQAQVYNGYGSLHLKTRKTDAQGGDQVYVWRMLAVPPRRRVEVDCVFQFRANQSTQYIWWLFWFSDGGYYKTGYGTMTYAGVRHNCTNGQWQYADGWNSWKDISGAKSLLYNTSWNRVKFSVDLDTGNYLSFRCGTLDVDVTKRS